jgi:hypothetical protein
MHYLPQVDESSPRGGWGICAPALPEVLTHPRNAESRIPFRFIGSSSAWMYTSRIRL